ncbi:caspase domain-containing protein [Kitasatospora sp. NPDC056446]|uniref:caspase family protein n=1 Tax=Kitasatospora sp. NPDC056446 TaxID=3345819 RepID=UPI0036B9B097
MLIGVSDYRDPSFPPVPAAAMSLQGVHQMLVDPESGGWPYERVTSIPNPVDSRRVIGELRRLARDTRGVFLLYFVGHGTITANGDLILAVTDTDADHPDVTGLEYSKIRGALLESPAKVKAVVLDCCYSGRAIDILSGDGQFLADTADIRGTYTLTAADHIAHAGQPGTHTAFTGELLDLIGTGIPEGPPVLTFADLYPQLRQRLIRRNLPLPNQRGTDTAGTWPVAKNALGTTTTATNPLSPQEPADPGPPSDVADPDDRNAETSGTGRGQRPSGAPAPLIDAGVRQSGSTSAFHAAWSGQESPYSYIHPSRRPPIPWPVHAYFSAALGLMAVLCIAIPLLLDPAGIVQTGPGTSGSLMAVMLGFGATVATIRLAFQARDLKSFSRLPDETTGWSLEVDRSRIATTDRAGRHEYPWHRIEEITIREVQTGSPHQVTGVAVRFEWGARPLRKLRPAGWPWPYISPLSDLSPQVVICILGPLSKEQRAELTEALARHGGQRWKPRPRRTRT